MIFECAIRAHAAFIISADKDILHGGEHRSIRTLTVRECLGM